MTVTRLTAGMAQDAMKKTTLDLLAMNVGLLDRTTTTASGIS